MRLLPKLRKRLEIGLKLYYRSNWVNASFRSDRPLIIIGGCERSGTTLLRATLDSHPQIAAGPESWLFVYQPDLPFLAEEYGMPLAQLEGVRNGSSSLSEFIDNFASLYCDRQGKPIWCEKSPRNIRRLDYIWEHFPRARVVHVIRDGRDVVCSLRTHPRHRRVGTTYVPTNINRPISSCIDEWVRAVTAGLAHRGEERYLEIRYENLVRDFEGTTRALCRHCNVEWSHEVMERETLQTKRSDTEIVNPEVRKPLYGASVARWRKDLSDSEQDLLLDRAGSLLRKLGYD